LQAAAARGFGAVTPGAHEERRVFIEYRNPVGIAQRDGVRDEEIQTFTLSGSVEDLDQVRGFGRKTAALARSVVLRGAPAGIPRGLQGR
jgi:hypothetical protein